MNVHYLPVSLTNFQKDLIEILVSLHAASFHDELEGKEPSNGTTVNGFPALSPRQLTYMFNTHVRAVANHPCLLVDHYMPRQFLRMEPTERLISSSDKFIILRELLHCLSNMKNPITGDLLRIAIISHSVKELDLLESITLGKQFKLKRLSGTALYAEGNDFKRDMTMHNGKNDTFASSIQRDSKVNPADPTDSTIVDEHNNARGSTPNGSSGTVISTTSTGTNTTSGSNSSSGSVGNSYTGYPKDDYDYSMKYKRKRQRTDDRNWLFLTTSTHLTHEETLLDEYSLDLIISFDPLLDPKLPAISSINKSHYQYHSTKPTQRVMKKYKIPIVKLFVKDTPDHYLLHKGIHVEHDAVKEYENIKNAMYHFLQCRRQSDSIIESKGSEYYTQFLYQLLSAATNETKNTEMQRGKSPEYHDVIPLSEPTDLGTSQSFVPQFVNSIYPKSQIKCYGEPFSIKSYQTTLMQRTISRFDAINGRYNENELEINDWRLRETERHNLIDSLKEEIGIAFKSKQDLDKVKLDSEKRFERANNESIKLNEKMDRIQKNQEELARLIEVISSPNVTENTIQQTLDKLLSDISSYKQTLDTLSDVNKKQSLENDDHRIKYQRDSSLAAAQATELTALKKTVETLKMDESANIGLSLNLIGSEHMEKHLLGELDLVKRRNQFIENYIEKMTKEYKLDKIDKTVSDSSSRPNKDGSSGPNKSGSGTSTKSNTPIGSADDYSRHRSTRSAAPSYT
ncbi:hypothetical protein C6P45_002338 [Maudiozyma exigua]|uniref:HDA1 complex subunit 2 n=1 Tax=Maudiozyma exigua TaxID=34358 RepID=A0A9P6VZ41_MAUEX|nr:hypothetical protein C6P45_002338 [Kazachstania exigua]